MPRPWDCLQELGTPLLYKLSPLPTTSSLFSSSFSAASSSFLSFFSSSSVQTDADIDAAPSREMRKAAHDPRSWFGKQGPQESVRLWAKMRFGDSAWELQIDPKLCPRMAKESPFRNDLDSGTGFIRVPLIEVESARRRSSSSSSSMKSSRRSCRRMRSGRRGGRRSSRRCRSSRVDVGADQANGAAGAMNKRRT